MCCCILSLVYMHNIHPGANIHMGVNLHLGCILVMKMVFYENAPGCKFASGENLLHLCRWCKFGGAS